MRENDLKAKYSNPILWKKIKKFLDGLRELKNQGERRTWSWVQSYQLMIECESASSMLNKLIQRVQSKTAESTQVRTDKDSVSSTWN